MFTGPAFTPPTLVGPLETVLINDFDRILPPPADRTLVEDEEANIMADDKVEDVNPCSG